MFDSVFYEFDTEPEEYQAENIENRIPFDPIETVFDSFDKDFLTLSSLDYFFNFTQTLGSILSPQNIDDDFHAFNLTSSRGYSDYILFRRPSGFVYTLAPYARGTQSFSKIESFTDIRKVGQYPDVIVVESTLLRHLSRDMMSKLVSMLRVLKYNEKTSFFILDLDFKFEIFEHLSHIETLLSRCSGAYFVIPPAVPFYETRYFLCFTFVPQAGQQKDFLSFPRWLDKMLRIRRKPNFDVFPYKHIVNWNILTAEPDNKSKIEKKTLGIGP